LTNYKYLNTSSGSKQRNLNNIYENSNEYYLNRGNTLSRYTIPFPLIKNIDDANDAQQKYYLQFKEEFVNSHLF